MTPAVSLPDLRSRLAEQAQAVAEALSDGDLAPDPLQQLTRQLCATIRQLLDTLTQADLAEHAAELQQLHALLTLLSNKALTRRDEVRQALLSLKRSAKVKQCYGKT